MTHVVISETPCAMHDPMVLLNLLIGQRLAVGFPMRSDRHDVGGTVGQPDRAAAVAHLHQVMGEITGRMIHGLIGGGDGTGSGVVVSPEMGAGDAFTAGVS